MDADSKLIVGWLVGGRDAGYAAAFMEDVAARLASRVQLTTDAHKPYLQAVEGAFGADVDYAQLIKLYGTSPDSATGRYSPAECTGIRKTPGVHHPGIEQEPPKFTVLLRHGGRTGDRPEPGGLTLLGGTAGGPTARRRHGPWRRHRIVSPSHNRQRWA